MPLFGNSKFSKVERFAMQIGLKLGKLTVIERTMLRDSKGYVLWKTKCDCGSEQLMRSSAVNPNYKRHNVSCGCQAYETNSKKETTHGLSRGAGNSIYIIWQGMKTRCLNKNCFAYKDYGGRGIKICNRWLESFEAFYEDMKEGYKKGLTLERKDVNGNYEKSNCIWITRADQANNRRTTIYVVHPWFGEITIKDAAKIVGISWQAMYTRVKHWPEYRWFEDAR